MNLSNLLNATKAEVWPRFQSLLSFCFELKVLNESKYSMPWVHCAFGNVCDYPEESEFNIKTYVPLSANERWCDQSGDNWKLGLIRYFLLWLIMFPSETRWLARSLPANIPPMRKCPPCTLLFEKHTLQIGNIGKGQRRKIWTEDNLSTGRAA